MEYFDEDSESEWSDDDQEVIGLFSDQKFDNIKQCIDDALNNYNFDIYAFIKEHKLDQYGCIRMINYIRSEITINKLNPETLVLSLLPKLLFLKDDRYYKPVLENDALLFYSFESSSTPKQQTNEPSSSSSSSPSNYKAIINKIKDQIEEKSISVHDENQSLRAINAQLTKQINEMKRTFHRIVLDQDYDQKQPSPPEQSPDIDSYYFDSYSHTSVHEMMLRDRHRTLSYKHFMEQNRDFFKDKVVMDVGCGTCVLSIFAAQCGAKHVIAVDCSDIAQKARVIVKNNGFADKISVIQQKLEDIEALPHGIEQVDIIISEWMGYFLLYESMLSSVLFARDKWLSDKMQLQGVVNQIFPNQAHLYMAAFDYDAMNLKFWQRECYGIDMKEMYRRPTRISEPLIIEVDKDFIFSEYACFKSLDMHLASDKDLDFMVKFDLIGTQDEAEIDALVVWFDCLFDGKGMKSVCLSTSPENEVTHWYSTVFLLGERWKLNKSECIHVELSANRCEENSREYGIYIELSRDKDGKKMRQLYNLNGCNPNK